MRITQHSYMNNSVSDYMNSLSSQLGTPIINNTIQIPDQLGEGTIKSFEIDGNFSLRCYHFTLKHDLSYKWLSQAEDSPNFKLVFFLDDNSNRNNADEQGRPGMDMQHKAVLFSTNMGRSGLLYKNSMVKRIVFLFSKKWLHENFGEASDRIPEIVDQLIKTNQPTFLIEEMAESHYTLAHELVRDINADIPRVLLVKSKALILVNDFLEKIVARNSSIQQVFHTSHYAEVLKVEKILSEQLDKPVPTIHELAQQCNISPSTLKRNFKLVFGKSLHTYCLEKKLNLGKSMIIAKNKSVSEIAYELGYDKVNSFSKAFKKQFGILPRDVNKIKSNVVFISKGPLQ